MGTYNCTEWSRFPSGVYQVSALMPEFSGSCNYVFVLNFITSLSLLCHLTVFHHPAVLLTLSLAVEFVGIGLAEAPFVGHAQTSCGVKGPDGWLACAGLGCHGQTAHSWEDKTEKWLSSFSKGFIFLFSQLTSEHYYGQYNNFPTNGKPNPLFQASKVLRRSWLLGLSPAIV